jgi:hypothetical protein
VTSKQIERAKKKIVDIKRKLAAEKKKYGCYDDSRGIRYLPTRYFIQLNDYSGGLLYLKWFGKNFPDDGGFPEFLFEATIILFKNGKTKEAGKKAFQTFCSNPYWFNKYFGKPIQPFDIWSSSNLTTPGYTELLEYSSELPSLADFSEWLNKLISTEAFINRSNQYIAIYKKLKTESDVERRHYLVRQGYQLTTGLSLED